MLLKEVKPQKLLMLSQMDEEYPRGARKIVKHHLKGEDRKDVLREWIKFHKADLLPVISGAKYGSY